jgi:16S rRNA (cytosine967-C5)-methyltransferase
VTREIAFDLLTRIQVDDSYANLLLPTLLKRARLDGRDAAFVQELAFGTIRNWLFYEKVIEKASGRKLDDIESDAQTVLVLGIHQLLDMRVPPHAAINESVNLAKSRASKGSVGFINAVLRKISTADRETWLKAVTSGLTHDEKLSVTYSHPVWIIKAFKAALTSRRLEAGLEDLLRSNNEAPKVSVVALPGFSEPQELSDEQSTHIASPLGREISGNPGSIRAVQEGRARVQDQGSQLVTIATVQATTLCSDEVWLDMCAGPGGKAALLAAYSLLRKTHLVCNEISHHRSELVRNALEPIGQFSVQTQDGRSLGDASTKFSRVLLDAPCTGLGALRRRPESRWRRTPEDLVDLVSLQRELLENAWKVLRPGGILGYVTCSPHLSETTGQITWAEKQFGSEMELLNANQILNEINPSLNLDSSFRTVQLWPHLNGTDAMFLALLRKTVN